MLKYIGRRLIQLIPVILAISFITFGLMQTALGDFVDTMYESAGATASEEVLEAKRVEL